MLRALLYGKKQVMSNKHVSDSTRRGKKWTGDEEDILRTRVLEGIQPSVVADELERTTGGIIARLCKFAWDDREVEPDLNKLADTYQIPIQDLIVFFERNEYRLLHPKPERNPREPKSRALDLRKKDCKHLDFSESIIGLVEEKILLECGRTLDKFQQFLNSKVEVDEDLKEMFEEFKLQEGLINIDR